VIIHVLEPRKRNIKHERSIKKKPAPAKCIAGQNARAQNKIEGVNDMDYVLGTKKQ
jgi:hypothetical protein